MALNITTINASVAEQTFSNISHMSPGEYFTAVKPLLFFIIGITIYALFIFKFYRFLAKRDIITLKRGKYYDTFTGKMERFAKGLWYVIENLVLVPLMTFFWFAVLAALMLFLSKTHAPDVVMLTAMAIVGAVRVTSYYSEDLSRDLAKMIPFALLGVFIVDTSYFSLGESVAAAQSLPLFLDKLIFYLVFVVLIEFIMRIAHGTYKVFRPGKKLEPINDSLAEN